MSREGWIRGFILLPVLLVLFGAGRGLAFEIRGFVRTADKSPIAGAVVRIPDSDIRAVTDASGAFRLDVPAPARLRLEASHPDYFEQVFAVPEAAAGDILTLTLTPLVRQREEVVVTALRYPEPAAAVPATGAVVSGVTIAEQQAPNVTEALQDVPGVASLGTGGFTMVPTVRGLARRRVLFLVDGARIESDRRTGPNASFVSPEDIDRIEVLRSPASVLYGSDAVGGVVQVFTRTPDVRSGLRGRLTAGYGSTNAERRGGLEVEGGTSSFGFLLSAQDEEADNYRSPKGEVLRSGFAARSLVGKFVHRSDKREIRLSFLGARGRDIGKPNRTSSTKPTWYPREDQNLVSLRWVEKDFAGGELAALAFANPNFLETRTDTLEGYRAKTSFSRTESTELGFQLAYGRKIGRAFRLEGGLDYFGRAGAQAWNRDTSYDSGGETVKATEERPYTDGGRGDIGVFLFADYAGIPGLDVLGGIRYDAIAMEARPGGSGSAETRNSAGTGFLAASYKIRPDVAAFVNLSRAYRVPGLSELYYTGISGRGFIVSNPNLRPETSLNVDAGLRFIGRRLFAGLYGFRYAIDDMIERYKVSSTVYTYGNIERGRIHGLEFETEWFPLTGWKLQAALTALSGKSLATGAPLNDVPPFRATLATRAWWGRFSVEARLLIQSAKDEPGPAEIAIPGYEVLDLKAAWAIGPSLNLYLKLANLFDALYLGRPDSEAVEEPGRSLGVSLAWTF